MKTHIKAVHEKGDQSNYSHRYIKEFSRPYRFYFYNLPNEGIKQFKCNICFTDFFDIEKLKAHMKEHRNQKLFNCALCNFKCAKIKDFVVHFRIVHKLKK